VAYECLAGSQPFRGGALDVAIAHRDRPLPPLPASVPPEVTAFVMMLTAKDPVWRPVSAGEAADQAGRLRDEFLSQRDSARLVTSLALEAPPPTAADDVLARPRRRRRPLAVAVLTLAALTCLVVISVTGFAAGSHPRGSPSHPPSRVPSQAAPAVTASPSGTATRSGTASPSASQSVKSSSSASPAVSSDASTSGTSSPGTVTDSSTVPPGQRHHKKGNGNENGNGNAQ